MFSYQGSLFLLSVQATALIDYHIVSCLSTTFFKFFHSSFDVSRRMIQIKISPVLTVSGTKHLLCIPAAAKPRSANLFCFVPVPSATKTILPSSPLIVNVFLVFYLFHAIQTIIGFPGFKRNNCRIFLLLPSSFFILRKRNSLPL